MRRASWGARAFRLSLGRTTWRACCLLMIRFFRSEASAPPRVARSCRRQRASLVLSEWKAAAYWLCPGFALLRRGRGATSGFRGRPQNPARERKNFSSCQFARFRS